VYRDDDTVDSRSTQMGHSLRLGREYTALILISHVVMLCAHPTCQNLCSIVSERFVARFSSQFQKMEKSGDVWNE
jgi:hypothetical protein